MYLSHYTEDKIYNMVNKTDYAFDNTRNMIKPSERNKNDGHGGHIIDPEIKINPYIDHKRVKKNIRTIVQEWVKDEQMKVE